MNSRNCDGTDWVRLGEIHARLAVAVDPAEHVCQLSVFTGKVTAGGAVALDSMLMRLESREAWVVSAEVER